MEKIPEAKFEIVPKGTIRNVCLTRSSLHTEYLPEAKLSNLESVYGIKDFDYSDFFEFQQWRMLIYRVEKKISYIQMLIQSFLLYFLFILLRNCYKNLYSI